MQVPGALRGGKIVAHYIYLRVAVNTYETERLFRKDYLFMTSCQYV